MAVLLRPTMPTVSQPSAVRNFVANIAYGLSSLRCEIVVALLLGSCRKNVKQFTHGLPAFGGS